MFEDLTITIDSVYDFLKGWIDNDIKTSIIYQIFEGVYIFIADDGVLKSTPIISSEIVIESDSSKNLLQTSILNELKGGWQDTIYSGTTYSLLIYVNELYDDFSVRIQQAPFNFNFNIQGSLERQPQPEPEPEPQPEPEPEPEPEPQPHP